MTNRSLDVTLVDVAATFDVSPTDVSADIIEGQTSQSVEV